MQYFYLQYIVSERNYINVIFVKNKKIKSLL